VAQLLSHPCYITTIHLHRGEGTSSWSIDTQTLTLAAAVAERLWTGHAVVGDAREAEPDPAPGSKHMATGTKSRLAQFVCMLNGLGMHAAPVGPGFCLADLD
jgi:hypothetical protein